MKVEQTNVVRLKLTDLEQLDPITIFIEDISPRQGKITIECYGKSWSTYFSGCGDNGLADFIVGLNTEYLVDRFDVRLEKYEPDFDLYLEEMRQKLIEMRKDQWISKGLARELYDVTDWSEYVTSNPYEPIKNPCFLYEREFDDLGFEGFDVPERVSSDYAYLCRIVDAVKAGLKQRGTIHG